MDYTTKFGKLGGGLAIAAAISLSLTSCRKDRSRDRAKVETHTIEIENVLNGKSLVQSGTFQGTGIPPLILPGQSASISFFAGKGQVLSFATMYGWSNDLFFAPENPGIRLYSDNGSPIIGDVSSQIKLWDNGTRINQKPGASVVHPGIAEATVTKITEVVGTDVQGNKFLPASQLIKATLSYDAIISKFTLTLVNASAGTANETPLSPGVWAVSYLAGTDLLDPMPIYAKDMPSANGLTNMAEAGDNSQLKTYISGLTGIFTPLSPVLVVVYNGNESPLFKKGEKDGGEGLKALAQTGSADMLATALKLKSNVKAVYVLKEPTSTLLLPMLNGSIGGKVSQTLSATKEDRIAIATMYGLSNDWFFATGVNGIDANMIGDASLYISLYDDGTAVDQYPGAGNTQANFSGAPMVESNPISLVPNPNAFTTLPPISQIIKVTLK
jgi:hypothetical protein